MPSSEDGVSGSSPDRATWDAWMRFGDAVRDFGKSSAQANEALRHLALRLEKKPYVIREWPC